MKPSRELRLEETAEEGADRLGQDGGPARRGQGVLKGVGDNPARLLEDRVGTRRGDLAEPPHVPWGSQDVDRRALGKGARWITGAESSRATAQGEGRRA
jgi:hypothetical protein